MKNNAQAIKDKLKALNDRFAIVATEGQIEFELGHNEVILAEVANQQAKSTISLHGGLIMTFQPKKQEPVLWISPFGYLNETAKSIRGGIPICWPWFGPHATDDSQPRHGFARSVLWEVVETQKTIEGAIQLTLELHNTPETQTQWPHTTRLQLVVSIGKQLEVRLITHNRGQTPFVLTEALHTYFMVSDVTQIAIHGLEGCQYLDKVDNSTQRKTQTGPVTIQGETDRVYLDTTADCVIEDPRLKRRIRIAKENSRSTVVWNPWIEKAKAMKDLGQIGYLNMVCVETANALDNAVTVAPNEVHQLQAVISIEPL